MLLLVTQRVRGYLFGPWLPETTCACSLPASLFSESSGAEDGTELMSCFASTLASYQQHCLYTMYRQRHWGLRVLPLLDRVFVTMELRADKLQSTTVHSHSQWRGRQGRPILKHSEKGTVKWPKQRNKWQHHDSRVDTP